METTATVAKPPSTMYAINHNYPSLSYHFCSTDWDLKQPYLGEFEPLMVVKSTSPVDAEISKEEVSKPKNPAPYDFTKCSQCNEKVQICDMTKNSDDTFSCDYHVVAC